MAACLVFTAFCSLTLALGALREDLHQGGVYNEKEARMELWGKEIMHAEKVCKPPKT